MSVHFVTMEIKCYHFDFDMVWKLFKLYSVSILKRYTLLLLLYTSGIVDREVYYCCKVIDIDVGDLYPICNFMVEKKNTQFVKSSSN